MEGQLKKREAELDVRITGVQKMFDKAEKDRKDLAAQIYEESKRRESLVRREAEIAKRHEDLVQSANRQDMQSKNDTRRCSQTSLVLYFNVDAWQKRKLDKCY